MPANDAKFLVEADSLDYATGAVLSREHDGKWHPVAFMSKALTEVEQNYEIYDIVLLKPEFFIQAMCSQGHVETVTEMEEVLKKI